MGQNLIKMANEDAETYGDSDMSCSLDASLSLSDPWEIVPDDDLSLSIQGSAGTESPTCEITKKAVHKDRGWAWMCVLGKELPWKFFQYPCFIIFHAQAVLLSKCW